MSETYDPDERFTVPPGTEPDDVLRRLLGVESEDEPEDEPESE